MIAGVLKSWFPRVSKANLVFISNIAFWGFIAAGLVLIYFSGFLGAEGFLGINKIKTWLRPAFVDKRSDQFVFYETIDKYKQAIAQYSANLTPENKAKLVKALSDLASLYYAGIPDKYTGDGAKIAGIPSNIRDALYYYQQAHRYSGTMNFLLNIADIYNFNSESDRNKNIAKDIYKKIERETPSDYLRALARDRLAQMNTQGGLDIGHFDPYPQIAAVGPRVAEPRIEPLTPILAQPPVTRTRITLVRDTPQNVHDGGILGTIKQSIQKLREGTDLIIDKSSALKQIRNFISGNGNSSPTQKQQDAIRALDVIEQNHGILSFANESESDAASLVWNRIASHPEAARTDLKNNLLNELSECVEHGNVVCSTGRFTRILDSLNLVDKDVSIKPTWALQQEMLHKAAKIRSDSENGSEYSEDAFKKKFINQMHSDYVKPGLMSSDLVTAEVNKIIDNL